MLLLSIFGCGHNALDSRIANGESTHFVSVSVGSNVACAFDNIGGLHCWGPYSYYEPPRQVLSMVDAGRSFLLCGLNASTNEAVCWGHMEDRVGLSPAGPFTTVGAGLEAACALRPDGSAECWGGDSYHDTVAETPGGTFTALSMGQSAACALDATGAVTCWGSSAHGEGINAPAGTFSSISVGCADACALDEDGVMTCWGTTSAPSGSTFSQVSVGCWSGCALDAADEATCWDWGGRDLTPPVGAFSSISVGNGQACGIHSDGALYCWGEPSHTTPGDVVADAPMYP